MIFGEIVGQAIVALRKESVDRNLAYSWLFAWIAVALRKESVDRNPPMCIIKPTPLIVALRKESVDRNAKKSIYYSAVRLSLSARRAWIEIRCARLACR